MKMLVRALEEIAEEEQVVMMREEQAALQAKIEQDKLAKESDRSEQEPSPATQDSQKAAPTAPAKGKKKNEIQDYFSIAEGGRFGGAKAAAHSRPGASMQLNTIEEEKPNETQTSQFEYASQDDSRALGSNNFRYSHTGKEFELDDESNKRSAAKLPTDIFNKSLTNDELSKMPFSTRSTGDRPDTEVE